ncbi:MAG: hypothetical protein AABX70_00560 [Nanoarchaeota archaeon]
MSGGQDPLERILKHDGVVHHPLGGGSYIFKEGLVEHITRRLY